MRKEKYFLWLPLLVVLAGCTNMSWVSAIGAREQYGSLDRSAPASGELALMDAPLRPVPGTRGPGLPYTGLVADEDAGQALGRFHYHRQEPDLHHSGGLVTVALPGGEQKFTLDYDRLRSHTVARRYRRWYGYPAQALQVVALPADVLMNASLVAAVPMALYAVVVRPMSVQ